jgi:predicted phage terminase large subunit-like protein
MNQQLSEFNTLLQQISLGNIQLDQLSNADLSALKKVLTPRVTKYIPHTPTPKQAAFLLLDCEEAFYGGAAGGGKLLPLTEVLFTDSGWKTIGTLLETDRVVALDGSWSEIEYITPVKRCPVNYVITFSDGSKITCNSEHLWTVEEVTQKNRNHRHYTCVETHILTTQEILDIGVTVKKNNKMQKRWRLPKFEGVQGDTQTLPISPYLLGYWLGDGASIDGSFTVGDEDLEFFIESVHALGQTILSCTPQHGACQRVVLEGFRTLLRMEGLLDNKYIPVQYMLSSREQRLQLLQGLMDSDGHIQPRGRAEWGQTIKRTDLFQQVVSLICSLGYKVSTTVAPSTYKGQLFESNRVMFTPREPVATLPRKIANILTEGARGDTAIWIEDIIQTSSNIPMKCVRIKHPSHVFMITDRFIPTHNSDALLMGALQYVDIPGYSAILFRKTYADLTKPGALMDRAKEWLLPYPEVRWDEKDKKFTFYQEDTKIPVSTIQFGYLENLNDKYNYQGGEYQFIGFDELTHIAKANYLYMFSRLRRLLGMNVPLRVRGASNPPDDDGGAWVRDRFIIEGPREGRVFIPAGLDDNPYLDKESYDKTLNKLDPVTRARLREGNWEITRKGNMFKRDWFEQVDVLPPYRKTIRWWDMAATDEEKAKKRNKSGEPDYTASLKVSEANGIYYVEDIIRQRKDPEGTEKLQRSTAVHDGYGVAVYEEQEPGSSGIAVISSKSRSIFKGYAYSGISSTGSKVDRASIASAAAGNGNIKVLRGCRNLDVFFDELESFPGGIHDDMVDCLSGCISQLGSTSNITGAPIVVQEHEDQVSTWLEDDLNAQYADEVFGREAVGSNYFSRFGT